MEDELTTAMTALYHQTGRATGYWAGYFLREVRRRGGLPVAKQLLRPERGISKGFEKLILARRADLSVEALVVQERFRDSFSPEELHEAQRRLDSVPDTAFPSRQDVENLHPDEVESDLEYTEGAVRRITVNAYERRRAARAACLRHHGPQCVVCEIKFEERYGEIGRGFIHVHHLRPMGLVTEAYRLNPKTDLVPVCPNCHAMLHSQVPPLDPEELRRRLRPPNHGPAPDGSAAGEGQ